MKSNKSHDKNNNVKPVRKIELSERHIKVRTVLVVVFILLALAAFAVGMVFLLSTDSGWTEVEANASEINCGEDFVFYYYLEEGGLSGEYKEVSSRYGQGAVNAYRIFNANEQFDGVNNLAYLNAHPNETVEVDGTLYDALELLEEYGSRSVYLAPVYIYYHNIFYAFSETEAALSDPYLHEDIADYFEQVCAFANNEESVNIELYGGNRVRLRVSAEYAAFLEANGVTTYLDMFMFKNAFIADYLAGYMSEAGYTNGILVSYDGFTRSLSGGQSFSMDVFDKVDDTIYIAGSVSGTGNVSAVRFRNYSLGTSDYGFKYGYSDGNTVTNYVDPKDGLYKSCINDLITYSHDMGCAELILNVFPLYIADSFDEAALSSLKREKSVYSVYCANKELVYNDADLTVTVLSSESWAYTKRYTD